MRQTKDINKKASKELALRYMLGFIIAIVSFAIFLDLGSQVKEIDSGIYFDKRVISEVSKIVTPEIRGFMVFISFLGSAKFYIPACLMIIYYFFRKKQILNIIGLLSGVLGSAIINVVLKGYFVRIRPEKYFQIQQTGFSFPSGHSMVGISTYFILTYLLFRKKPWNTVKIVAWIFTVIFVLLIGLSRVYLGVHWPTDVIAGFALGFTWVYINIVIIERFSKAKNL